MEILKNIWPFIVIQYLAALVAIFDMAKQRKTKNLNIGVWVLIVLFVNFVGPLLYFVIGRDDE